MHQHIKPGLYIDGLQNLCAEINPTAGESQPREAGSFGNWSFEKNTFSNNVLTFVADNGKLVNRVKFLPYLKTGTSYTASDNCPVISGPFSGCIMRGFKKDGVMQVAHVNRSDTLVNAKLDTEWSGFGSSEDNDHITKGHIDDWLALIKAKKYKTTELNTFGLWVIAIPLGGGWRFYEFLVHNKANGRMKVKKIYW